MTSGLIQGLMLGFTSGSPRPCRNGGMVTYDNPRPDCNLVMKAFSLFDVDGDGEVMGGANS